ncbi:hypothetical protein [Phenylobacterium sp.]|uniref:hypothetical protein n=1 Tax=Phenylobacterium sp. TaxID=1871053 RepID=UPI002FD9C738
MVDMADGLTALHQRLDMLQCEMERATLYGFAAVAAVSALSPAAAEAARMVLESGGVAPAAGLAQGDLFAGRGDTAPAGPVAQNPLALALEQALVEAARALDEPAGGRQAV